MFSFLEMTHLDVVTHTVSVLLLLLLLLSCFRVQLFVTPWAAAHQKLPFLGVSRQEHWSGVPLPSPVLCINWSLYTVLALTCQLGHVGKMLETQWPGVRGTGSTEQNVQGQVQMSCSSPSDKCPQGRHWTDAESRHHCGFGDLATAACFLLLSVMYQKIGASKIRLSVTNPRPEIVILYRPSGVTKVLGRWPLTINSHDTTSFSPDSISWSVYYYLLSSDF